MVNTRGGGDSPFLLQRVDQLVANLQAGVFPVRWMPDAAYGLGFPFFNYYSALPYYMAGVLNLLGLDVLTALKLVQTLGFVTAGLAMYGWARQILPRTRLGDWLAWLAGVAYTVAPFHLVNVYVRGDSLSEFWAFSFYPLILWGLDRMVQPDRAMKASGALWLSGRWLWPACAYAGLILTHNISALIFSPFILLYLLFQVLQQRHQGRAWGTIGGGALVLAVGLLLASWTWLPALMEKGVVQTASLTDDYFHHSRHFRTTDLVQGGILFTYDVGLPGEDTPFAMGLMQAILAGTGSIALALGLAQGRLRHPWSAILSGFALSTLMITPLSRPLWDHIPLLPMIQFPWRFLSIQALFAAMTTVAGILSLARIASKHGYRLGLGAACLAGGALTAVVLIPLQPERLHIAPNDITRERLQTYELFTQNIGTTIRYEWLPTSTVPRPFISAHLVEPEEPTRAVPLPGSQAEGVRIWRRAAHQAWTIWGEGGELALPLLHWPGWEATIDGQPVDTWPLQGSGYLTLTAPPGEHRVELRLRRTRVRAIGELASLLGLAGAIFVVAWNWHRLPWRRIVRVLVGTMLTMATGGIIITLLSRGIDYVGDDLTMDFDRMPYLHHNPGGIRFGDAARLMGYRFSSTVIAPGQEWAIALDWEAAETDASVEVRVAPVATLRRDVPPLTSTRCKLTTDCSTIRLKMPQTLPRGVYLVQLRLFDQTGEIRAESPRGDAMGVTYLQPIRVPEGPPIPEDAAVVAQLGSIVRLHRATVASAGQGDDRLHVDLTWSTERSIPINYGISIRLRDAEGNVRGALDTQPGYGYLPTTLWQPGELVHDRYLLASPSDLSPDTPVHILVLLYNVATWEPLGQARLPEFTLPLSKPIEAKPPARSFIVPSLVHTSNVEWGEEIRLVGYELMEDAGAVSVTLWWQAIAAPAQDYTVFVHLFNPTTEEITAQHDSMPRDGTYPTSLWLTGEVVSQTLWLIPGADWSLETHQLAVGLYDDALTRLSVVDRTGQHLPNDRLVIPLIFLDTDS
jgi:hypothetical protein